MTTHKTILTEAEIEAAQNAAFSKLRLEGYNGGMGGETWDLASARAIEQAILEKQAVKVAHEYSKGFIDGQIDMRDREEEQMKPLAPEQLLSLWLQTINRLHDTRLPNEIHFGRAIEKAHGIKEAGQ